MSDNFGLYSKYYNLLYKDKDYRAEVNYVIGQLRTFAPNAKTLLEFGSGTGGHGLILQAEGYQMLGIERSEQMVSEAKANGLDSIVADISNFDLGKKFDVIISLFHVISYLTDNSSLVKTFKNANTHLHDGGIFLFDVWYTPAVYEQKASPRIKRMQNEELAVIRVAEPKIDINNNIVDVQYTVLTKESESGASGELYESHPMRHFSIPEMNLLAELTGFEVLKAEEFLSGETPSENTWGVCFILKKK